MGPIGMFFSKHAGKLVVLIMFVFTAWYYSPMLFNPSGIILQDSGDAIKNYFSFEWHVQKDTSLVNYSGSNYPYGEHHGYTDGNPLLGNFLKVFSFLKPYSIEIFNLSLLFSLLLCALFVFKILKEFKVPDLLAVLGAVGIAILCPQVFRLGGHFALAYGFAIPLVILLLLRFEGRKEKVRYSVFIALSLTALFFIHPYLGMIALSFVALYGLSKIAGEFKDVKRNSILFCIQSVAPVLVFFLYMKLTDTHVDRPQDPFGFLLYTASIETVFISTLPPFRHFLSQVYEIEGQEWEGIAYVGMTSLLTFLGIPYLLFRRGKRMKSHLSANPESKVLLRMLIAASVLLMFSMGYPFKWGMETMLDNIPLIKQFRCPGRFAWIFYFVATIFSVVLIARYFLRGQRTAIRLIASSLLLLLFAVEGIPYHQVQTGGLFVKNCFNFQHAEIELRDMIQFLNKSKQDALIPLPFFHIGTDYYDHNATDKIKRASNIVSIHTGIPMMANLTPRVSLIETERLITGVLGNSLMEKEIRKDIRAGERFVILYNRKDLTYEESILFSKGKVIWESENYILKGITEEELFKDERPAQVKFFGENRDKLIQEKGHFLSDSSLFYYEGSMYVGNMNEENVLKVIEGNMEKEKIYELSFWYEPFNGGGVNNEIFVEEVKKTDGKTSVVATGNVRAMANIRNGRILGLLRFRINSPENKYRVCLKGHDDAKGQFRVNDIMIKESDVNVYREKNKDTLIINNIPVSLKKKIP